MPDDSEQRATEDVTATTESYGGPVSDQELADVYLPEGQHEVHDTGSPDGTPADPSGEAVDPPD